MLLNSRRILFSCFRIFFAKAMEKDYCYFCQINVLPRDLYGHLFGSSVCKERYLDSYDARSLKHLIVKLFRCLNCNPNLLKDIRLHLSQNRACFMRYQVIFQIDTVDGIADTINSLKRSNKPSRSVTARALEYDKQRSKCVRNRVVSINDYKSTVSLGNYKKCAVCLMNCTEYGAREIKEYEELFKKLDLSTKKQLKRFEKFNVCNSCSEESRIGPDEYNENSACLKGVALDGEITFVPDCTVQNCNYSESISENDISVYIPNRSSALEVLKLNSQRKIRNIAHILYSGLNLSINDIQVLYENELAKYRVRQKYELWTGTVSSMTYRTLSYVNRVAMDSHINYSSEWVILQKKHMQSRQDQLGKIFVSFKIDLPKNSIETLATCLIQDGFVITIDGKGCSSGQNDISYTVHLDHTAEEDCGNQCTNRVDLKNFLASNPFDISQLGNRFAGTYVTSLHQKLASFTKHVIGAPSCSLFSKDYIAMIIYNEVGIGQIVGACWPIELEKVNCDLVENGGVLTMQEELIAFVERSISVSQDARIIRSSLMLSEGQSEKLSGLVKNHQNSVCDVECEDCQINCYLPSLQTMIAEVCVDYNLFSSINLKKKMHQRLCALSRDQKLSLSSAEWLLGEFENITGQISNDNNYIQISIEEEDISFLIDNKLLSYLRKYNSPLMAVYHYAISTSSPKEEYSVIYKRLNVKDCFTRSYNPTYMMACESPMEVELSSSCNLYDSYLRTVMKKDDIAWHNSMNSGVILSHRKVSLAEAISLYDGRKKMILSSSPIIFTDARPTRKYYFKKATKENPTNFKLSNSTEEFELKDNIISRHFQRINGKNILLAETFSWYDYIGSEKSQEIFQIFSHTPLNIPLSDIACACPIESCEYLPIYLLCNNGDVLKLRKCQKIMSLPNFKTYYEKDYMYSMLYYPLQNEEELFEESFFDRAGRWDMMRHNER